MLEGKFNRLFIIKLICMLAFYFSACGRSPDASDPANTQPSSEKRGQEIVAEFLKRDASPFRKIRVRFTISTEDEPQKIYEIDNWRRQTTDATTTLSQIVKPAEDSDLGSLTLEPKGAPSIVTTYASSRGDFRETDTKKMFFGGLTAGELLGEWYKFDFRLTSEREQGGIHGFEVEGKLKQGSESAVSRSVMFFRADNYFPVELHFFDAMGREIRSYRVTGLKESGGHVYAVRTEVENPVYKAKIVIEFLSVEYPQHLDDGFFSREKLRAFARQ
jgi:hypothetical protein